MKSPHLLLAGRNLRKIKANLEGVLDQAALGAIEAEIEKNATQLIQLAREHLRFARRLRPASWRQSVSRAYYATYSASRAVRLQISGDYTTDSEDHKRVGELPEGFPKRNMYANQLGVLREDRNACDYDHTATDADLVLGRTEALALATGFVQDVCDFLGGRGLKP